MIDVLKAAWAKLAWYQKAVVGILIPLIIAAMCFESGRNAILGFILSKSRSQTDEKVKDLEKTQAEADTKVAEATGRIEQLDKELDGDKKQADEEDPVAFHNGRPPGE